MRPWRWTTRLYEQQRTVAEVLQRALLPETSPDAPGLLLAARYRPHSVDLADITVGGDLVEGAVHGSWAVTIGDVCGKGAPAAALTAMIRHTVRAEVRHGHGPCDVVRRLNTAMLRDAGIALARFATVVHAHVTADPTGADVSVVNAGHLPPFVLRGDRIDSVEAPGSLLGVYPDISLTQVDLRLDGGDALVLYTDGITEARDMAQQLYPEGRLRDVLSSCAGRPADAIAGAVLADVTAFDSCRSHDDIAIVVVQAAT